MDNTAKFYEMFKNNVQGSIVECDYLVEKTKHDEDDKTGKMAKATITTGKKDRHGTTIETKGGDISHFMKNPVILFNHGRDPLFGSLPIAKAKEIETHRNSLVAHWTWATEDLNPKAVLIKNQWENDYLQATSIGFLAHEIEEVPSEDPDKKWWPDVIIKKWELVEFSIVPVQSNRESLKKSLELQLIPFLEHMANDQKQLTVMLTEIHSMLDILQPVDVIKNYRELAKLPNLVEYKTLQEKNVFLESKGFTFEEKFEILHKSSVKIDELIEFYSVKTVPVIHNSQSSFNSSFNFSLTEMAELQTILQGFTN